ncbi:hypothetical protein [Cystobacter fuscus]|uniref:hypothetical protein n=1 Tax=Cystobacter fuscus TaxID=43 RepID=UPI0037C045A1
MEFPQAAGPVMTTCGDRQAKQALRALFEETLDAEGFARLRAHVAGCGECREAYERLARVESALEQRALPGNRQALLERELFARLSGAPQPVRAPAPTRRRFSLPSFWVPSLAGLALASVAVVLVVPRLRAAPDSEWSARGSAVPSAWGVRAFCVGPEGDVREEARSGETLACGEGSAVQFSYTAPEAALLTVETRSASGEPLRFFPAEGGEKEVAAGVDVPLPYSTPVQDGWLSGPLEVRASFSDARGRVLSQTRLTLVPR